MVSFLLTLIIDTLCPSYITLGACSSLNKTVISAELCRRGRQAIVILAERLHQGIVPLCESRTISSAPETESPLIQEGSTHMGNWWQHNSGERSTGKRTSGQSSALSGHVGHLSFPCKAARFLVLWIFFQRLLSLPAAMNSVGATERWKGDFFPSRMQTRGARESMPSVWPAKWFGFVRRACSLLKKQKLKKRGILGSA